MLQASYLLYSRKGSSLSTGSAQAETDQLQGRPRRLDTGQATSSSESTQTRGPFERQSSKSISEIARQTGRDRKTIRRLLREGMNSLWPTISVLLLQRVLRQEQPPTRVGGEFQTGAI